MTKQTCPKCKTESDIPDCVTCGSWTCPNCGNINQFGEQPETGESWLDVDGICKFPASVQRIPNGVYIASGFTDILELVVGLVWNKPGPGFGIYDWDKDQPIPKNVLDRIIGVQMDVETINYLQEEYAGRGILIGESDGDIQDKGLTPDEWQKKYGSNGMAALAKQRLFWYAKGGGVEVGKPYGKPSVASKIMKLGKY